MKLAGKSRAFFPSGRSNRVGEGSGRREGLRWQVLGSSEPPALLLRQDHLHVRVLLLLEAPVGAVITIGTAGRAEPRERSKAKQSKSFPAQQENSEGSDGE